MMRVALLLTYCSIHPAFSVPTREARSETVTAFPREGSEAKHSAITLIIKCNKNKELGRQ
jgi:hypothetical protein